MEGQQLKKTYVALYSTLFISASLLQACQSSEPNDTSSNQVPEEEQQSENHEHDEEEQDNLEAAVPTEPTTKDICIYCEMGIPHGDDPKALFTAQAITADGERLFFDDSGCLENAEAEASEPFSEAWVKDFTTNEWIQKSESTVVYDENLETQMSYHYAFFQSEDEATSYVEDSDGELSSWDQIKEDAEARASGGHGGMMHHGEGEEGDHGHGEGHGDEGDDHEDEESHSH